jgi:hypothetical protein
MYIPYIFQILLVASLTKSCLNLAGAVIKRNETFILPLL